MGKIKEGLGTLIGNAGEHLVMAELLKRGIIAALAPRNSPAFDILATNHKKTVNIRVKTKSGEIDAWQWSIKKNGKVFNYLKKEDDFSVLVDLTSDIKDTDFFIIPTYEIDKWMTDDFNNWVHTPGKKGQQRNPDNKKRTLLASKISAQLGGYKNNWDILWK